MQPASSVALRIVEGIQDDEGFLDLVEQGQQSFERSNAVIQKMTEATQVMGARITQRATELQEVNTEWSTDIRRVKQLINAAADDMDNYVSEWGEARPVFSDSFGRGIKAFGRAAVLSLDFGGHDPAMVESVMNQIRNLREIVMNSRTALGSFRLSVANSSRATTTYNHAKRRVTTALDEQDSALGNAIETIDETERMLADVIAVQSGDVHVAPDLRPDDVVVAQQGIGWSVLLDGRLVAGAHGSQESAIEAARAYAKQSGPKVAIVNEDGSVMRELVP